VLLVCGARIDSGGSAMEATRRRWRREIVFSGVSWAALSTALLPGGLLRVWSRRVGSAAGGWQCLESLEGGQELSGPGPVVLEA
jgi:hypothetical protein